MKKIILTTAIALVAILSTNAQTSYGVKGGVNFASILNENINGLSGRTSFNIGAMGEIETSSSTSVQIELMYSGQGFSFDGGIIDETNVLENTFKLDYLNIPVVFNFKFGEGFSFGIGAQVGFLLSAKEENDSMDIKDAFTTASFDMLFDLAYKFDNGLIFNARYNLGLTDIWKGPTTRDDCWNDYYYYYYCYEWGKSNGVFQISVGYFFN